MKNIHVSNDIGETNCVEEIFIWKIPIFTFLGQKFADGKITEKEISNKWISNCSTLIEDVQEFSENLSVGALVEEIDNLIIDEFHYEL